MKNRIRKLEQRITSAAETVHVTREIVERNPDGELVAVRRVKRTLRLEPPK